MIKTILSILDSGGKIYLDKLITKKGTIGLNSGDIDNLQKPIIDNLFKFMNKLDDSIICNLSAKKIISPDKDYHIKMKLTKMDLSEL